MFARIIALISILSAISIAAPGDVLVAFPTPGPCPSGMAFDGQNLWIADFKTDSLYAVSPATGKVVGAVNSPSYRPYGLAWDGSYLWIVDGEENSLLQLDTKTGVNVKTIPSPLEAPTGLTWDGKNLWLADATSINEISSEDGTTIKTFKAPSGNTTGLAFDGSYLWAADRISNRIYMIYPAIGEVIMMFDSPAPYPWGLAIADRKLFNVDYQSDSLYQIMIDDGRFFSRSKSQRENMNFTHEVRNYGPGLLKSLDIYLAIPENSDHQTLLKEPVYFADVAPNYVTDKWGQPFAAFHFTDVPSGGKVRASYLVTADLYETRYYLRPERVGVLKDVPKEIREKFLADDTKFDLTNPVIQNAVKEAVGDQTNMYWKARRIYRWIIDHLLPNDLSRGLLGRPGAGGAPVGPPGPRGTGGRAGGA